MLIKLLKWLFGDNKKRHSNIIEPPGGIDGMSIDIAKNYAMRGYKISRITWPIGTYVAFINGIWFKYTTGQSCVENWEPDTSDSVSCDWNVIGKV